MRQSALEGCATAAKTEKFLMRRFQVRVVLMRTERMCSVAFKDRHTQEVTVPAGSSVAVPYTIVPLAVGMLPLEVMVLGRDLTGADSVKKELRVVVSLHGTCPLLQL